MENAPISALSPVKPLVLSTLLSLALIGGLLAIALSGAVLLTPLSPAAVTCAIAAYVALAAVVLSRISRFHPFRRFGLANVVTTARAAVACGLFGLIVEHHFFSIALPQATPVVVVWIVGTSLFLDGVDGWIARRQGLVSRFGARFDMEVDAFTILSLAALGVTLGKVAAFALALGAMRYGFVAASRLVPALRAELPERLWRKAVCVLQYGALLFVLLPSTEPQHAFLAALAALVALTASFAADIAFLMRQERARAPRRGGAVR